MPVHGYVFLLILVSSRCRIQCPGFSVRYALHALAMARFPEPADDVYWVEVWLGCILTCLGGFGPLHQDDIWQVLDSREMARRIASGNGRATDFEINGFPVGCRICDAFGWPKYDHRWLALRSPFRRYPYLVRQLEDYLRDCNFSPFWCVPMRRPQERKLRNEPIVRVLLAVYDHPRGTYVWGPAEDRIKLAHRRWWFEDSLNPMCRWCGLPTTLQCTGIPTHVCRQPVCNDCIHVLARCPDCLYWIGFPQPYGSLGADERLLFTGQIDYYHYARKPLRAPAWHGVWDGVSTGRPLRLR